MPKCLFKGGPVIWPFLLSSVAARAVLSLAATCPPAGDESPEGRLEADLVALMWLIVNLVNANRLQGFGLPLSKWGETQAESLSDPPRLFLNPLRLSLTLADMRKTVFG
jgi:hypothetical protein